MPYSPGSVVRVHETHIKDSVARMYFRSLNVEPTGVILNTLPKGQFVEVWFSPGIQSIVPAYAVRPTA